MFHTLRDLSSLPRCMFWKEFNLLSIVSLSQRVLGRGLEARYRLRNVFFQDEIGFLGLA